MHSICKNLFCMLEIVVYNINIYDVIAILWGFSFCLRLRMYVINNIYTRTMIVLLLSVLTQHCKPAVILTCCSIVIVIVIDTLHHPRERLKTTL
jgi:hypothetical protein